MFDLDSGVYLDEIELILGVDQKLARTRIHVTGGANEPDGGFAQLGAHMQWQSRRRRFLHQLLMTALQRAIAVPAINDMAVGVSQYLDLDVPGAVDELFDVDPGVLESGLGFVAGRLQCGREVCVSSRQTRMPLPPPPAAALISTG